MSDRTGYTATPRDVLLAQIMDSTVPKNEREHAAAAEIAELKLAIAVLEGVA